MQWGELRRQAKSLESEIDIKLTEFGKVGSSSLAGCSYNRTPHITQSSTGQSYGDLCNDIESLLQRLKFKSLLLSLSSYLNQSFVWCCRIHSSRLAYSCIGIMK